MKTVKLLLLFPLLLNYYLANAQYVGQINNASTLYNPSFVGSKNAFRVASGFVFEPNNQTSYNNNINYIYNSFLSLDAPIKKISGAIGLSYINKYSNSEFPSQSYYNPYANNSNNLQAVNNQINLTYAQIFTIRNKNKEEIISIRPALTFGINNYRKSSNDSILTNINIGRLYPSVLLTGKKYFIGAKYISNRITGITYSNSYNYNDNLTFYNATTEFNSLHIIGGYTFQRKESKFSFTPIIEFHFNKYTMRTNDELWFIPIRSIKAINLNFKYGKVLWGFNGNGFMAGYQNDKLRICLSAFPIAYDFNKTVGEISVNYIFKKN